MADVEQQLRILTGRTDTVLPPDGLREKLESGVPLRVKLGMDPTAPAVTLGWAVVLRKLRQFQELGHTAVLIVGDFTAQVGDPSGKSATRKRLSEDEVRGYADSVLEQFSKVLLPEPLEVRYNSEWLSTMRMPEVLELTSMVTVAQMLERDDFGKRFSANKPISVMEFMYPLLQGMDSVAVEADVELGGSDQLWNLMVGRILQERFGQPAQVALTVPLLTGLDGSAKMSQSLDNYISVVDSPTEMYGKAMSVPDALMREWFELTTTLPDTEIRAVLDSDLHPAQQKRRLAASIVELYWGVAAATEASEAFDRVFKHGGVPDDIPEFPLPAGPDPQYLPGVLVELGLVKSTSEGRRMLEQGAVRIDGQRVSSDSIAASDLVGGVVQVGKRRFAKIADSP